MERSPESHNYYRTFITVADDTNATAGTVPPHRAGNPTVAMMQFEMLSQPFVYTQEQVLFDIWLARQEAAETIEVASLGDDELEETRRRFFAKGQACLRASPLPKAYGWGVIFDERGRAALCPMESDDYRAHLGNPELTKVTAMRSTRA